MSTLFEPLRLLNERGVDLVELSGGSYESPAGPRRQHPGAGDLLPRVRQARLAGAGGDGGDGHALAVGPTLPRRWQAGEGAQVEPIVVAWKNKAFAAVATQSVVKKQLTRLSQGRPTHPRTSPLLALIGNHLKPHWCLVKNSLARRGGGGWRENALFAAGQFVSRGEELASIGCVLTSFRLESQGNP